MKARNSDDERNEGILLEYNSAPQEPKTNILQGPRVSQIDYQYGLNRIKDSPLSKLQEAQSADKHKERN